MKNHSLIKKLNILKNSKAFEIIEGELLQSIKGGTFISGIIYCNTYCRSNKACNTFTREIN